MTCGPKDSGPKDSGQTLIELVIALATMSVAMTIFTTGVLTTYRVINATEARASAQTQVNLSVLRLDSEVRYAEGISDPGVVAANPQVEYLIAHSGTSVCVELRLNVAASLLQRRQWVQPGTPSVNDWRTVAFGVAAASTSASAAPFALLAPDATFPVQRLRVRLTATAGAGRSSTAKQVDVTLAALNTTSRTASSSVCAEGRSVL